MACKSDNVCENFHRYTGRGFFLEPPSVHMCNGIWQLCLPDEMQPDLIKAEDMCK